MLCQEAVAAEDLAEEVRQEAQGCRSGKGCEVHFLFSQAQQKMHFGVWILVTAQGSLTSQEHPTEYHEEIGRVSH